MTESQQVTPLAVQELLRDGKLAGSWTLDAARSEIGLKSKSMWGMVPVKGVFREATGSGTVSAAGDVTAAGRCVRRADAGRHARAPVHARGTARLPGAGRLPRH